MQEPTLSKPILLLQATADFVECGIVLDGQLAPQRKIPKMESVARLVPVIDDLLKEVDVGLNQVALIGVNVGPAPFMTLRTVIATANGLAFSSGIPLVGVEALRTTMNEYIDKGFGYNLLVVDALGGYYYFALLDSFSNEYDEGCLKAAELSKLLAQKLRPETSLYVFGYKPEIVEELLPSRLMSKYSYETTGGASLAGVWHEVKTKLEAGTQTVDCLFPNYMKSTQSWMHRS